MNEKIEVLDYHVYWRSVSDNGLIGEIFFVTGNRFGGSLSTPVGIVTGFIEPGSEYSASHWKILLTVRDIVRYDGHKNKTRVFLKSAYGNKIAYHIRRIKELFIPGTRINPHFPNALKDELIRRGYCASPIAVQIVIGDDEYVFSDVEFDLDL